MENKRLHLEMLQGIINRMSQNSFHLKGWSVVLVSALFALSVNNSNVRFIMLAYIPSVIFWGLDGYFLSIERVYRTLYEHVRKIEPDSIDFSMDTSEIPRGFEEWASATFSKTLMPFHGSIIVSIIIVMFIHL